MRVNQFIFVSSRQDRRTRCRQPSDRPTQETGWWPLNWKLSNLWFIKDSDSIRNSNNSHIPLVSTLLRSVNIMSSTAELTSANLGNETQRLPSSWLLCHLVDVCRYFVHFRYDPQVYIYIAIRFPVYLLQKTKLSLVWLPPRSLVGPIDIGASLISLQRGSAVKRCVGDESFQRNSMQFITATCQDSMQSLQELWYPQYHRVTCSRVS